MCENDSLSSKLLQWHSGTRMDFPWRQKGLSPWAILLSECLLRQTNAAKCKIYFPSIISKYVSPYDIIGAPQTELENVFKPLGLQKQRANALYEIAETLITEFAGNVPEEYSILLGLPHVGHYIAGAVTTFAFGKRAPLFDINIKRVVGRYFDLPDKTKADIKKISEVALSQCPKGKERSYYYAILDLGNTYCKMEPKCDSCPLTDECLYSQEMCFEVDIVDLVLL